MEAKPSPATARGEMAVLIGGHYNLDFPHERFRQLLWQFWGLADRVCRAVTTKETAFVLFFLLDSVVLLPNL